MLVFHACRENKGYNVRMIEFTLLQKISVWVVPVLFAITVHEVAHGWVASRFGDLTAKMLGRLSLNPIKHIDPVGTILIPALTIFFAGFVFGYAKPVPVTYQNLKNPKTNMAWVALAGPGSNFLMACFWALWIRLMLLLGDVIGDAGLFLISMGVAGIFVNIILLVINMIPIPPLDGGRVLVQLLPPRYGAQVSRLEPFGFLILIGLLVLGILGMLVGPVIMLLMDWFSALAGISGQIATTFLYALGAISL